MSIAEPVVSLIVARANNGVIGRDNQMPWHLPPDLRRLKALTLGHPCIMGRKTWDSILMSLGKPLPGRTSIVVTRKRDFSAPSAIVVDSPRAALDKALQAIPKEIFVLGGAELYQAMLPLAQRAYVTEIDLAVDGDAVFPDLDPAQWRITERGARQSLEANPGAPILHYSFLTYQRQ